MKSVFLSSLFVLCILDFGFSQCNIPVPPSPDCANAPILCDLDGYCSQLLSSNPQPNPSPFCGQIENSHWLSFVAATPELTIVVTPSNCQMNSGMQGHIYRTLDCFTFQEVSNCWDPGVSGAIPFTLAASNLTIGEQYHILLDGKGGDVCEYSIEVTEGATTSPDFLMAVENPVYLCQDGLAKNLEVENSLSQGINTLYNWETIDGNILDGLNSPIAHVNTPGIYTLAAEDTLLKCTDTLNLTVLEADELIAQVAPTDTINCKTNFSIVLSPDLFSSSPSITYEWRTIDDQLLASDILFIEVDQEGTFVFIVKDEESGCEVRDTARVLVDTEIPIANAGEDDELNCITENIILQGGLSSQGTDIKYNWTTLDGNIISGDSTLFPLIDVAGTYNLEVVNVRNGCSSTDSVIIILNDKVPESADLTIKNPCFGDLEGSVTVNAVSGGNPPYFFSLDDTIFYDFSEFQNVPIDEYHFTVRDVIGCEWDTTFSIFELTELAIDLEPSIEIKLGNEIRLPTFVNRPEEQLSKIEWLPIEDLSCDTCLNPIANPFNSTEYEIRITDENDCPAAASINVLINKASCVYIPNAFSPNNDGNNDVFYIHGIQNIEKINHFLVFNRWGSLLFERKDFQANDPNLGWDGTHLGENLNSGIYVYIAEIQYIDGRVELFRGDVLLVR